MAKKRPNVIPIIEDARHPAKYRMLIPMVDVIFADVAQPDQVGDDLDPDPKPWAYKWLSHSWLDSDDCLGRLSKHFGRNSFDIVFLTPPMLCQSAWHSNARAMICSAEIWCEMQSCVLP